MLLVGNFKSAYYTGCIKQKITQFCHGIVR